MKISHGRFLAALAILLLSAGCGALDLAPGANPDRVLTGTITAGAAVPAEAEVVVRLVATTAAAESFRPANQLNDAPIIRPTGPSEAAIERVLGEHSQKLTAGTMEAIPFRIEYS